MQIAGGISARTDRMADRRDCVAVARDKVDLDQVDSRARRIRLNKKSSLVQVQGLF